MVRENADYRLIEYKDQFGVWHEKTELLDSSKREVVDFYLTSSDGMCVYTCFMQVYAVGSVRLYLDPTFELDIDLVISKVHTAC